MGMWTINQRVISQLEPELGIGIVTAVDIKKALVKADFPQSSASRAYSITGAPIKRFFLKIGEEFRITGGESQVVASVHLDNGLARYQSSKGSFHWEHEVLLEDCAQKSDAIESIFSGNWCSPAAFKLRKEAWQLRRLCCASPVKGLVGARITPAAHQMFIGYQTARRAFPRVILADEVGLGKTIEAGLIYRALAALGRAERVLVVCPDSLVHQWMTELFRRFGDMFSVLDPSRCIEEEQSLGMNPFESNQKNIVSTNLLRDYPDLLRKSCEVNWDLLIVDEAHHLKWDAEYPSPLWIAAKRLADKTQSLLLLTATPRQRGPATQFGLLNLVDPRRFSDFQEFLQQSSKMEKTAKTARLIHENLWSKELSDEIALDFSHDTSLQELVKDKESFQVNREKILAHLVDLHGTGRVLFRNRRERLKGFPKRVIRAVGLVPSSNYIRHFKSIDPNSLTDSMLLDYSCGICKKNHSIDPPETNSKLKWLVSKLLGEFCEKKVLVICTSKETVTETHRFLMRERSSRLSCAMFHEDLSLVERDKQAALFADPKGAQILISSEIGGEGRNFQFSQDLVLLDLPRLPDLLEQRIGRLDRIGQKCTINIHVPWLKDTPEEVLFRWYHEGLNCFEHSWNGADEVLSKLSEELLDLLRVYIPGHRDSHTRDGRLTSFIGKAKKEAQMVRHSQKNTTDLLLDINSFDPQVGEDLVDQIGDADDCPQVELFLRGILDFYGVDYEELDDRGSLVIEAGKLSFLDYFPGLSQDSDTLLTFDRTVALRREDFSFVTLDHKLVEACLGLMIDRGEGIMCVCKWIGGPYSNRVFLEMCVVLEASGPRNLELGRYLPVSIQHFSVDHLGNEIKEIDFDKVAGELVEIQQNASPLTSHQILTSLRPAIHQAEERACVWQTELKNLALNKASLEIDAEIERIQYLERINPMVDGREVSVWLQRKKDTIDYLHAASFRLDSFKVTIC